MNPPEESMEEQQMGTPIVHVTRRFDAAPERVFDAFLDPGRAKKFMFATEGGRMVHVEIDARVGGSFVFVDRRDGEDVEHTGEYLEIDRPRRLVFTLSVDESAADRVIVDIVPRETGCELTLTHQMRPEWAEYASRTEEGWTGILDGLATTLQDAESPAADEYGTITEPGTIRFERWLPGPIERVWAYLTESGKRGTWLASGEMDLRVGGRVELNFFHADLSPREDPIPDKYSHMEEGCSLYGRITRCEPPRLLSYTWGEGSGDVSEVTFELTPQDGGVVLVLTHRQLGDDPATLAGVAAGWHTHLGILVDHLDDRQPRGFWSTHVPLEGEYEQRFTLPQGAA